MAISAIECESETSDHLLLMKSARKIRLKDVLDDFRGGLDEAGIMRKYRISPRGMRSLMRKLDALGVRERPTVTEIETSSKIIHVRNIVDDICSGMSRDALRSAYDLTEDQVDLVFRKLLELKAITRGVLFGNVSLGPHERGPANLRFVKRSYVDFDVPICDADNPSNRGLVKDVTEDGIGTVGLEAHVEEEKRLVIAGDAYGIVPRFEARARCRWFEVDKLDGENQAGFQIVSMDEEDRRRLGELIALVTLIT